MVATQPLAIKRPSAPHDYGGHMTLGPGTLRSAQRLERKKKKKKKEKEKEKNGVLTPEANDLTEHTPL